MVLCQIETDIILLLKEIMVEYKILVITKYRTYASCSEAVLIIYIDFRSSSVELCLIKLSGGLYHTASAEIACQIRASLSRLCCVIRVYEVIKSAIAVGWQEEGFFQCFVINHYCAATINGGQRVYVFACIFIPYKQSIYIRYVA